MLYALSQLITNVILLFFPPPENNIHVHDLLTFQQITVVSKAKGATLFACDLQVCKEKLFQYSQIKKIYSLIHHYNNFYYCQSWISVLYVQF